MIDVISIEKIEFIRNNPEDADLKQTVNSLTRSYFAHCRSLVFCEEGIVPVLIDE